MTKNHQMILGPTLIPLHFETDLDHHLDTKKNIGVLSIYLLHALAEVCALRVLLSLLILFTRFQNDVHPQGIGHSSALS